MSSCSSAPSCPSVPGCPFFNDQMNAMPSMANMLKKKYCLSGYQNCARWTVAAKLGKGGVPKDLYPGQTERVAQILNR